MATPQKENWVSVETYDFSNDIVNPNEPYDKCITVYPAVQFCYTIPPTNSTAAETVLIVTGTVNVAGTTVVAQQFTVDTPFNVEFSLNSVNSIAMSAVTSHIYRNSDGYHVISTSYSSSEPVGVVIHFSDVELITPFK